MERLLMKFGCTAGQAAARAPLYTGVLVYEVLVLAAWIFLALDQAGRLDRQGYNLGLTLPAGLHPRKKVRPQPLPEHPPTKPKEARHGTYQSKQPD